FSLARRGSHVIMIERKRGSSGMLIYTSRLLWSRTFRIVAFWVVVILVFTTVDHIWSWINLRLLRKIVEEAINSRNLAGFSSQDFAFSLAAALFACALALGAAYFLLHTVMVWLAIAGIKRRINNTKDMAEFANSYEEFYSRLSHHALLSHAWKEFDETLVPPKE